MLVVVSGGCAFFFCKQKTASDRRISDWSADVCSSDLDGFPVRGSGGPITVPPADKMQIAADGTISILPLGAEKGAEMQVIDKLKLVSPAGSDTLKGLDKDRKSTRLNSSH